MNDDGVEDACVEVDAVVHCATDPARATKVDVVGTKWLLEAACLEERSGCLLSFTEHHDMVQAIAPNLVRAIKVALRARRRSPSNESRPLHSPDD